MGRGEYRRRQNIEKICLRCSAPFLGSQTHKFCSGNCRHQHYRETGKARASHDRYRYGIEPEDYEKMFAEQNGVCAICGKSGSGRKTKVDRLFVDHRHGTKKIRGLLCHQCNIVIGLMKENPEMLRKAAEYLEARNADVSIRM